MCARWSPRQTPRPRRSTQLWTQTRGESKGYEGTKARRQPRNPRPRRWVIDRNRAGRRAAAGRPSVMTLATHFRQLAQRDKADLLMALRQIAADDSEAETACGALRLPGREATPCLTARFSLAH